jgi:hypothetical protein
MDCLSHSHCIQGTDHIGESILRMHGILSRRDLDMDTRSDLE